MAPRSPSTPRRLLSVLAVAALALLLSACLTGEQQSVLDRVNQSRAQHGRRTLPTHDALNSKAQAWAENLARRGSLAHSNLSSGLPSCWRGVAENVGTGSSIAGVHNAFMASSGHRANILNTSWKYVGVGHAKGGGRIYVVHVFMSGC